LPIIQQDRYLEGIREKFDQERRDFSAEIFGSFGRRTKKASKKMSKIFQDDWEAAGPEVLAVARAKLAAFIEILKTQAYAQ